MSRLRRFLCNILDWHSPSNITYDEVNSHSHCKHCGKKILQDSYGNWFSY